ncbi:MAG: HNH endonuclease [Bacteroidetes bacterium]|nr:HNH endonuclease [Bacteroidota bacterium]MBS1630641.1 HNH endonuclease [Bacteroidota bacterium]
MQAAHIVPHNVNGKDDLMNGIALCRLHHWAFDVGWFGIEDNFSITLSRNWKALPENFGKFTGVEILPHNSSKHLMLPKEPNVYPHAAALTWHRSNVLSQ